MDFDEFIFVVEGHQLNPLFLSEFDMTGWLAGMSIYDVLGRDTIAEHLRDFSFAGTIEASAQRGDGLADGQVATRSSMQ